MSRLLNAVRSVGTDAFASTLKRDLENLAGGILPLQDGTTQGGQVDDSHISATILDVRDSGQSVQARVGVFFSEIVGGCSCGDDPVSVNAYCEILVSLDRHSGDARFAVAAEREQ